MNISRCFDWRQVVQTCCAAWMTVALVAGARAQTGDAPPAPATVIEIEGTVQTARARATEWRPARTNEPLAALDRVRTREESRAALRLTDRSLYRLGELSEFVVESTAGAESPASVGLLRGLLYFFHRGNPKDVQLRTRAVSAAIRGTEFQVEVADNGRTVLTLFDGEVELTNPQGTLQLISGEQATIDPGQPPVKTPMLVPKNDLIQWCLYYPGVLDAAELNLTPAEQTALQSSLTAYRSGDLLQALTSVPAGYQPASDSARVYLAAVLLSVGKLDAAQPLLDAIPPDDAENTDKPPAPRLAEAFRRLIAVVKNSSNAPQPGTGSQQPKCASLRLAESYQHQAQADLKAALIAAREATTISPDFAFAWARVAELEFSFGRRRAAQVALSRSLELAPRNAQAVALRGFLLAAEDRIAAAFDAFNEAIALDGALGNAWLGRGLCQIRRGELDAGREDLQVAAVLEPQRALFRSYLGKAWHELGEQRRAEDELRLAKSSDPRDPTAFLYEALLLQEENRINEAITSLEHSQELNDNRRVYRSRLLLDQDQAVRGANLANIYRDAGLTDWSVREAGKAVNADYANYSAHLFLANSYNELRDPRGVNLRYETPWLSEYLIANLLAPAGAGLLSQAVSQQEYSKLFERDRLGFASATEYLSRGAWSQSAVQFGTLGRTAYALEGGYLTDPGQRRGQNVEDWTYSLQLRQQVGASDGLYAQVLVHDVRSGDLTEYYSERDVHQSLKAHERQEPLVVAGWHHEWAPGHHTLLLGSRLAADLRVTDPDVISPVVQDVGTGIDFIRPMRFNQRYRGELEIYSMEAQQIWQRPAHTTVAGARFQRGDFETRLTQEVDTSDFYAFALFDPSQPTADQSVASDFERVDGYAYHHWNITEGLQLIGGLAWNRIMYPRNHRFGPVSSPERTEDAFLPKAGAIWKPWRGAAARLAYTRSLGGASFDQSFRLEPTQVAGMNQSFRSIIPEAVAAANAGANFETFGAAWEQKLATQTYVSIGAERLGSTLSRWVGSYDYSGAYVATPGRLAEHLTFREYSAGVQLNQLVGDEWAFGAGYRWSGATLRTVYPDVPAPGVFNGDPGGVFASSRRVEGDLHEVRLRAIYNHPAGYFASGEGLWIFQDPKDSLVAYSSSDFWQWNVMGGWRSRQRRVELAGGVLNLCDRNYRLHPVNLHGALPRERTFVAQCRFSF